MAESQITEAGRAEFAVQSLERAMGTDFKGAGNDLLGVVSTTVGGLAKMPPALRTTGVEVVAGSLLWSKFGDSITGAASKFGSLATSQTTASRLSAAQSEATDGVSTALAKNEAAAKTASSASADLTKAQAAQTAVMEDANATDDQRSIALFNVSRADATAVAANQTLAESEGELVVAIGAAKEATVADKVATGAWASTKAAAGSAAGGLADALGPVGIALVATAGLTKIEDVAVNTLSSSMTRFHGSAAEMASDLQTLGATGQVSGQLATAFGSNLQTLSGDVKTSHSGWVEFADDLGGVGRVAVSAIAGLATFGIGAAPVAAALTKLAADGKNAKDNLKDFDTALATDYTKNPANAAAAYSVALKDLSLSARQGKADFPQYAAAVAGAGAATAAATAISLANYKAWITTTDALVTHQNALTVSTTNLKDATAAYAENQANTTTTGPAEQVENLNYLATWQNDVLAVAAARRTVTSDVHSELTAQESLNSAVQSEQQAVLGLANARFSEAQAARSVVEAVATEQTDTKNLVTLTTDLAAARWQATQNLIADNNTLKDGALSLQSMKYQLANDKLAAEVGPTGSTDPYAQAELNLKVQQDEQQIAEQTQQQTTNTATTAVATAQGVNNAPGVVSATTALANGYKTVADDANSVTTAVQSYNQAQNGVVTAAQGVVTANQGVANAVYGVGEAQNQTVLDTQALGRAQNTYVEDQRVHTVTVDGLMAVAKANSGKLRDAVITDSTKQEAALNALGLQWTATASTAGQAMLLIEEGEAVLSKPLTSASLTQLQSLFANPNSSSSGVPAVTGLPPTAPPATPAPTKLPPSPTGPPPGTTTTTTVPATTRDAQVQVNVNATNLTQSQATRVVRQAINDSVLVPSR